VKRRTFIKTGLLFVPGIAFADRRGLMMAGAPKASGGGGGGGGASSAWVLSITGSTRSDDQGKVGCSFTPTSNIEVTDLGIHTPSSGVQSLTHTVEIRVFATDVLIASASVNLAASAGDVDVFQSITPASLTSGTKYVLVRTTSGGELYFDGSAITVTSDATANSSVYYSGGWVDYIAGQAFGGVTMKTRVSP
jgi:hypothetical protein